MFWFFIAVIWILLGVLVFLRASYKGDYYSVSQRRMPCGRIQRREVVHINDAWIKTVTLFDEQGRILAKKTRTIEPEHCQKIAAGQFVQGLWKDCAI